MSMDPSPNLSLTTLKRGVAKDGLDAGESVEHGDDLGCGEFVLGLEPLASQASLHMPRGEKWEQGVHGILNKDHQKVNPRKQERTKRTHGKWRGRL